MRPTTRAQFAGIGCPAPVERPAAATSITSMRSGSQSRRTGARNCSEAGIQTGVHYPIPIHLQPAYRDLGYAAGDFPVSEHVAGKSCRCRCSPSSPPRKSAQWPAAGGAAGAHIDGLVRMCRTDRASAFTAATRGRRRLRRDELALADALRAHLREALHGAHGRVPPWREATSMR